MKYKIKILIMMFGIAVLGPRVHAVKQSPISISDKEEREKERRQAEENIAKRFEIARQREAQKEKELERLWAEKGGWSGDIQKEWTNMLTRTGYNFEKHGMEKGSPLFKSLKRFVEEIIDPGRRGHPGPGTEQALENIVIQLLNGRVSAAWQGHENTPSVFKKHLPLIEEVLKSYVKAH